MASDPQDDVVGQWQACSPETIGDFSAVGYYFGREIHQSIECACRTHQRLVGWNDH